MVKPPGPKAGDRDLTGGPTSGARRAGGANEKPSGPERAPEGSVSFHPLRCLPAASAPCGASHLARGGRLAGARTPFWMLRAVYVRRPAGPRRFTEMHRLHPNRIGLGGPPLPDRGRAAKVSAGKEWKDPMRISNCLRLRTGRPGGSERATGESSCSRTGPVARPLRMRSRQCRSGTTRIRADAGRRPRCARPPCRRFGRTFLAQTSRWPICSKPAERCSPARQPGAAAHPARPAHPRFVAAPRIP